MTRAKRIEIRGTETEIAEWKAKAEAAGISLSELVREALARTRTWTARDREAERRRTMELAKIGNNLNQLARWANTYKAGAQAAEVLATLAAIERELFPFPPPESGEPPC